MRGTSTFLIDNCAFMSTGKNENNTRVNNTWEYCVTQQNELNVTVFPNPARNFVRINLFNLKDDTQLQLYNTIGQLIQENTLLKGSNYYDLSLTDFNTGIYLINLIDKKVNIQYTTKVIKSD